MPINESKLVRRERWPLEFDLQGIPRDNATRQRLLDEQRSLEESNAMPPVTNNFAVDYQQGNGVVDINNPPQKRYVHREFPKMVYHHDSGHVLTVLDQSQYEAAARRGFQDRPAPGRDYTQVKSGMIAPVKPKVEEREKPMSVDQIEALDAAELAALEADSAPAKTDAEADAEIARQLGEAPQVSTEETDADPRTERRSRRR